MSPATWGDGFGDGGWGGPVEPFELLTAEAVRENVIRLSFNAGVYASGLEDYWDALQVNPRLFARYAIAVVTGTTGLDGRGVRPVGIVEAYAPGVSDGLETSELGRCVDLVLDRPMSPYPAKYSLTADYLMDLSLTSRLSTGGVEGPVTVIVDGLFKEVQPVSLDAPAKNRDIHNPQTREALFDPIPDPDNPLNLGTMVYDETGDYGFDEGITAYKKRILRRLITRKDGFVHLPGYGVGVLQYGKKLALASTRMQLVADAEVQIRREPETAAVKVNLVPTTTPGYHRLEIRARMKSGAAVPLSFPVRVL